MVNMTPFYGEPIMLAKSAFAHPLTLNNGGFLRSGSSHTRLGTRQLVAHSCTCRQVHFSVSRLKKGTDALRFLLNKELETSI